MKIYIIMPALMLSLSATSQNLVVNPGAEDNPRGTGWTIVSAGATACNTAPTNTYVNWTMIPDGSGNYPVAHGGTRTFFAGCNSTTPAGPFEVYQDIDLSADAALIDAGNLTTNFSGYIQTPISPQGDAGRFIVDFMNAANGVLGTSYANAYQSFAGGSGAGWVNYSNTRVAPVGTRKIRIRMQATISVGPAINVYFDDISLTKASVLPLTLTLFDGETRTGHNELKWSTQHETNTSFFAIERSTNVSEWNEIGRIKAAGHSNSPLTYSFRDLSPANINFYRLRMADIDGKYTFSDVVKLSRTNDGHPEIKIIPNPVADLLTISSSFAQKLELKILSSTGQLVRRMQMEAQNHYTVNINNLAPGYYILQLTDKSGKTTTHKFSKR